MPRARRPGESVTFRFVFRLLWQRSPRIEMPAKPVQGHIPERRLLQAMQGDNSSGQGLSHEEKGYVVQMLRREHFSLSTCCRGCRDDSFRRHRSRERRRRRRLPHVQATDCRGGQIGESGREGEEEGGGEGRGALWGRAGVRRCSSTEKEESSGLLSLRVLSQRRRMFMSALVRACEGL